LSGSKIGGQKAAATNKARYGEDFYRTIGRVGGSRRVAKGFAMNRELAAKASKIGGHISRRTKVKENA